MQKPLLALLFLLVFAATLSLQAQETRRAALIVRFGDGDVETRCVSFSEEEISGYDLLNRSGLTFEIEAGGMGAAVCRIDQTGCPAGNCFCQCSGGDCVYWSYWHQINAEWNYSSVGASAYLLGDGAVEGWSWGPGSIVDAEEPPALSFDDVCNAVVESPTPTVTPVTPQGTAVIITPPSPATAPAANTPVAANTATATAAASPTAVSTSTPTPTPASTEASPAPTASPTATAASTITSTPASALSPTAVAPTAIPPAPTNTPAALSASIPSPTATMPPATAVAALPISTKPAPTAVSNPSSPSTVIGSDAIAPAPAPAADEAPSTLFQALPYLAFALMLAGLGIARFAFRAKKRP